MATFNRTPGTLLLIFLVGTLFLAQHLNVHGLEYRDDEVIYFRTTQAIFNEGQYLAPQDSLQEQALHSTFYNWFVLQSYKFFGVNWVGARFPSVLFAVGTLCLTWSLARVCFGEAVALLSCLILGTTPMFFRHAKDAVPDMALNFFVVFALWAAYRFIQNPQRKIAPLFFFLACALAFLIKGYAGLVVPLSMVIIYLLLAREARKILQLNWLVGLVVLLSIIGPWVAYMVAHYGKGSINYLWGHEMYGRLVSGEALSFMARMLKTFSQNILFYGHVLFSYFAPWCLFLLGVFPLVVLRVQKHHEDEKPLVWFAVWFLVVLVLFSFIYTRQNHYLLTLSTPFAILVSYFLREGLRHREGNVALFLKYVFIFLFCLGFAGLLFFHLGLAGAGSLWLLMYLLLFVGLILLILYSPQTLAAPVLFGLFMAVVFSQTTLMVKAGVSTHTTLQKLAAAIRAEDLPETAIVSVGSKDIHEKELQVYCPLRVQKAGTDDEDVTRTNLVKLMDENKEMYCLILERDYQKLAEEFTKRGFKILQEDYIFRRKVQIDVGFFLAAFNLDHAQIRTYLKEKILLLKRSPQE